MNFEKNTAGSTPERELDTLLFIILDAAMRLAHCRAGTIYSREGEMLRFHLVRNLDRPDLDHAPAVFPPVPMGSRTNLCTLAAAEGKTIHIPDTYAPTRYDLSGLRNYDRQTCYTSRSILVCPIMSKKDCTAVLQLINAHAADGTECDFTQTIALVEKLANSVADVLPIFRLLSERDRLAPAPVLSESQCRYMEENYYGILSPLESQSAAEQGLIRPEMVHFKQARMEADRRALEKNGNASGGKAPYEVLNEYIAITQNARKKGQKKSLRLAAETNIDKSTLSRLRHGQLGMSRKYLYAIIIALDLPYEKAEALLGAYGWLFSGGSRLDMFIQHYLVSRSKGAPERSVTEINIDLHNNGLELLGSQVLENGR